MSKTDMERAFEEIDRANEYADAIDQRPLLYRGHDDIDDDIEAIEYDGTERTDATNLARARLGLRMELTPAEFALRFESEALIRDARSAPKTWTVLRGGAQ